MGLNLWRWHCEVCAIAQGLVVCTSSLVSLGKIEFWQNGFAESFHARLRDEFMDGEAFLSVRDAQVRLEGWRRYWNEERLHSSLGYTAPAEFAAALVSPLESDPSGR